MQALLCTLLRVSCVLLAGLAPLVWRSARGGRGSWCEYAYCLLTPARHPSHACACPQKAEGLPVNFHIGVTAEKIQELMHGSLVQVRCLVPRCMRWLK